MNVFQVGEIKVYYDKKLDGGGRSFGQLYVPIVKRLIGKSRTCFEAFSGPAFIGFSLLAHNLCEELVVADINPEAINYVKLTVEKNRLSNRVRYYVSDVLDGIPESEKFDLVVGNPPHFNENTIKNYCSSTQCDQIEILKSYDEGWELHRKFYLNIHKFLNKGANVILVENLEGSDEKDFVNMINEGGLKYMGIIKPEQEDIILASYISIRGLKDAQTHPILVKIIERLPYSAYRMVYSLGLKLHYQPLINYVNFLQKFYFIWSKT